jgi:hypothetical protein
MILGVKELVEVGNVPASAVRTAGQQRLRRKATRGWIEGWVSVTSGSVLVYAEVRRSVQSLGNPRSYSYFGSHRSIVVLFTSSPPPVSLFIDKSAEKCRKRHIRDAYYSNSIYMDRLHQHRCYVLTREAAPHDRIGTRTLRRKPIPRTEREYL